MSHPTSEKLAPAAAAGKYLTVALAGEAYAFPVARVREIIRLPQITAVAQMPPHVRGVVNLRGAVIPIVDLRVKFGLAAQLGERTCIVVVHLASGSRQNLLGLIVDAVDEVAQIGEADIQPPPELAVTAGVDYLVGIAKIQAGVKLLLDVDRVVQAETLPTLSRAA
jgi:purine-binding chemotaxis protein CheW